MRHKDLMFLKLTEMNSILLTLNRIVSQQEPLNVYKENIEKGMNVIEEMESLIESEPITQ